MLKLRFSTPGGWLDCVQRDFSFLQDHAAQERKVSASALKMAAQHPERNDLVLAMIEVAKEDLEHFARVYQLLQARGCALAQDAPDPYIGTLRKRISNPAVESYLLDRLVLFGIIEARGCERFGILAEGLSDPELQRFLPGAGPLGSPASRDIPPLGPYLFS